MTTNTSTIGNRKHKYIPTEHAIERLNHRFGISPNKAIEWFNNTMKSASYLSSQKTKRSNIGTYEIPGARITVNTDDKIIITIKPLIDTSILKPVFEREQRKLRREVTRNVRKIELMQAELMAEIAEHAMNKARARNPKTRELIQTRMDELQTRIERMNADKQLEKDRMTNFVKATEIYS